MRACVCVCVVVVVIDCMSFTVLSQRSEEFPFQFHACQKVKRDKMCGVSVHALCL